MDTKSSYPHQHHDERKSREQLIQELAEIRNRAARPAKRLRNCNLDQRSERFWIANERG